MPYIQWCHKCFFSSLLLSLSKFPAQNFQIPPQDLKFATDSNILTSDMLLWYDFLVFIFMTNINEISLYSRKNLHLNFSASKKLFTICHRSKKFPSQISQTGLSPQKFWCEISRLDLRPIYPRKKVWNGTFGPKIPRKIETSKSPATLWIRRKRNYSIIAYIYHLLLTGTSKMLKNRSEDFWRKIEKKSRLFCHV